jgi:hypothetical protein
MPSQRKWDSANVDPDIGKAFLSAKVTDWADRSDGEDSLSLLHDF